VALLKRLRKCEQWLYALAVGFWQQRSLARLSVGRRILRLVDATTVKEPGPTGSLWRIHYSLQVPSLRCDFFKVTANQGEGTGEGLWQIPVQKGEYLLADRGYSNNVGMVSVARVGAYLTVRLNQGSVLLEDAKGHRINLLPRLEGLKRPGQVGSWKVFLSDERQPVAGRVCAIRKTRAAIELAHRRIKHKARDESRPVNPETLEYAKFVTVFSTFPENEFSAKEILEWYRLRWQIAMDWIMSHPAEVAVLDLKKILYHWIGRAHTGNEYRLASDWMKNAYRVLSVVLIVLGGIGYFSIKQKSIRSLLLVVFLYSTAVSAIFFVQSRHRTLKVDPFLIPLTVIGTCKILTSSKQRISQSSRQPSR